MAIVNFWFFGPINAVFLLFRVSKTSREWISPSYITFQHAPQASNANTSHIRVSQDFPASIYTWEDIFGYFGPRQRRRMDQKNPIYGRFSIIFFEMGWEEKSRTLLLDCNNS